MNYSMRMAELKTKKHYKNDPVLGLDTEGEEFEATVLVLPTDVLVMTLAEDTPIATIKDGLYRLDMTFEEVRDELNAALRGDLVE